ncbi:hypothetical protein NMY22_g1645 [Coprinellus aureogranulatus]|nr:hypothetical protein NMY22_g1645 [Coprinellus aureogranulatus]
MRFSISLLVGALIAGVTASNVQELTPDNFDDVVGKGANEDSVKLCALVNLAPVWEQLADAFEHAKDKVVIAKVDADGVGRPLGQKYGVQGFPTLKFRSAQGRVTKKTGVKSKLPVKPPSHVKKVDVNNFDDVVLDSNKSVFITFTAPWCGHCKNLKPTWEKLAQWFAPESDCIVANMNADDEKNKPLASKYDVNSYPTIKFFPKGNDKTAEDYSGGRTDAALVEFLNKKCGTHRAVGGGLNAEAGRVADLDAIAKQFIAAAKDTRETLLKDAVALAGQAGDAAKHYIRAMEKVAGGAEAYIEKESKRLAKILAKKNLSEQKLDELKIKANILAVFIEKAKEEKKEEETIAREKAEL